MMDGNIAPKKIELSDIQSILSRTDLKGVITYANKYFSEVSGYSESELMGSPHNIVRHPDMPKVVFKIMWDRIQRDEDILAVVKNQTKNGDYYWVTTLFETKYHPLTKKRTGYLAIRRAAPEYAIKTMEPIYKKLLEIEAQDSITAAEDYLIRFLMKEDKSYDEYIKEVVKHNSISISFFNAMKRLFA